MNVWLSLPFLAARELHELTVAAAESGLAGLALSDHVCVPVAFDSPYPYGSDKNPALPPETPLPDPLVAIAALAMAAPAVRFMTAVLIAPLRHPVLLAKCAATTATMSGDRFDLGVGVGWLREEFEALGLDHFDQRGAVIEEMLPLLRQLWTGVPVSHEGKHFSFDAVAVNPAPNGPIPIFVGGHTDRALRRCAVLGDGWVGANPSVEELTGIVGRLQEQRVLAGTADRPFEIRTGIRGTVTPERVRAVRELGVTSLLLAPWQIGQRRESVFDIPVPAIADALPDMVASVLAA